jgi:hypothetical protein
MRVIEQASRGDPRHLIELLCTEGAWPDTEDMRARVLVVLMLGPWPRYREAFLERLNAREDAFEAGAAELQRMCMQGRRGAPWVGSSGKPAVLNEFHRAMVRLWYAALRADYPDKPERDIREEIRSAFALEEISEDTLRSILKADKPG